MGARSRRKGHQYERDLCHRLHDELGLDTKRSIQTRGAASEGCDVEGVPGTWVEVKCGKQPNPRAALKQAQRDTDGRRCVAIVKDNGAGSRPPFEFVVMSLDDWIWLLRESL